MTATDEADAAAGDGVDASDESATDHGYFRELEDLFIALRGAPFLLSPSDWRTAKAWCRQGIPLELVRRVLREVFERREERGADDIVSLRYFRRPVENAWKKARELAAGGERAEPEPFDLKGRLERLAAALPADLPDRERWADEIEGLSGASGEETDESVDMEAVEKRLGAMENEMLAAVSSALGDAMVRDWETKVEEALSRLARRLPEEEMARSRRHLHRRLLRQHAGLPVLSLFSPEAEGG